MADLKNLTPEEFLRQIDNCDLDAEEKAEIRRRLEEHQKQATEHLHIVAAYEQTEVELRERLAKCEAALRANLERHGNCLCSSCDAARSALEK